MTTNEEKEKFVLQPLDRDQVNYALEMMQEIHPLAKTPLYVVFPALRRFKDSLQFLPWMRYEENQGPEHEMSQLLAGQGLQRKVTIRGKERSLQRKSTLKRHISHKAADQDPLASLGYGIVAYTNILYTLIWAFAVFSVLLIPTMLAFKSGNAYEDENFVGYADGMIANLGYSSAQCTNIPTSLGSLHMSCSFGTIGGVLDYGINSNNDGGDIDACITNDNNSACKPPQRMADLFNEGVGKDSYRVTFDDADLGSPSCINESSLLFVQFTCIQDEDTQADKYGKLVLAVATTCLISFLFILVLQKLYKGGRIQQLEWDISTVTAGDYTVEFNITQEAYMEWYTGVYKRSGAEADQGYSPALSLKRHLTEQVESAVNSEMQRNGESRVINNNVKVADITFAYNNGELIRALRERGNFIALQQFDDADKKEKQINELFSDFESLTRPTEAFITFEEASAADLALTLQTSEYLLGVPMKFKKSSEPTDIIWENRNFTESDYTRRQASAFSVIFGLLLLSFAFIFIVARTASNIAREFPQQDCPSVEETYGSQLQKFAVSDYDYVMDNRGMPSSGALQCFCTTELERDYDSAIKNTYDHPEKIAICSEYSSMTFEAKIWLSSLKYFITTINFVLRTVCISLVAWIGYPTETKQLEETTKVTFWMQFFNTAFLLLLVNADLSEQPFSFFLEGGSEADFDHTWFKVVGNTMVGTMIFVMLWPIIEAFTFFGLRLVGRILDRGFSSDPYVTSKTSIQAYMSTYQGPTYLMHYKYSALLNIIFVTMMYGFGIPILFPIAVLAILVLYLVEKIMLYYAYALPPMYDERLSQSVLNQLYYAPFFYLGFGYWMASNKQMLSNDWLAPRERLISSDVTQHTVDGLLTGDLFIAPAWPLVAVMIFMVINLIFGNSFMKWLSSKFPNLEIGDVEIQENIDNYWASLDEKDRNWAIKEDDYCTQRLGLQVLTKAQKQRLMSQESSGGRSLQGCHSYDILANPLYFDDFQYVSAAVENRDNFIIDDDAEEGNDAIQSDVVRLALNLAYMNENRAHAFQFNRQSAKETIDMV